MTATIWGYPRGDGSFGIRNHVAVIAAMDNANRPRASLAGTGAVVPMSAARSGRQDPHTVEAPVRSTTRSTVAAPPSPPAPSCPRVTDRQLQTMASAGQSEMAGCLG